MKTQNKLALAAIALAPALSFASAPTSVADLATGVSFSDASGGVLAVGAALITLYVVVKAARMVIGFVRGR